MDKEQKRQALRSGVRPTALVSARAGVEASEPYMVEVTKGQSEFKPSEQTLIVKVQVRPGINYDRAKIVFQHALIDVFTESAGMRFLDYFDPRQWEIENPGLPPALKLFSMTAIFYDQKLVKTTSQASTTAMVMAKMRQWHQASGSW
jgi:hypothetical protein